MAGDIEEQTPPKNFKPAIPAQAPNPPTQPVAPAPVAQPAPAPQAAPVQPAATPTPVAQPIPAKPLIPKPAPIKPPVKTVKTTTPAAPKKPEAPKGSTPAQPATPTANGEQPKKSILGSWWFLSIMTIIIIGLIAGIFVLIMGNPFTTDDSGTPPADDQQNGNQSQIPDPINDSDIDLEVFTCEEIVQTNKEILNISCEEGAIISVVEGIDYITTIYADSTEDACVNGPTELLEYANNTCGDEAVATINSLAFVPIAEPELVP